MTDFDKGGVRSSKSSNAAPVEGGDAQTARLMTREKDSSGRVRARLSLSYASRSTEIVLVAIHRCMHALWSFVNSKDFFIWSRSGLFARRLVVLSR